MANSSSFIGKPVAIASKTRQVSAQVRTNPGTEAEPQQIVAQRLLSCLQYHVPFKSSTEDLTRPTFCIVVKYRVDIKLSLLQHRSR